MAFEYSPLSCFQIRLLEIEPGGSPGPEVQCTIHHTDLYPISKEFIAVSYAWDREVPPRNRVMIDGKELKVSEHVHQLLVEIRNQASRTLDQPNFVWIDTICINQENKREKTEQVRLMEYVYQTASFVFSWLGPRGDDSDMAMDFLRSLSSHVWEPVRPVSHLSLQHKLAASTEYDVRLQDDDAPAQMYDHRSLRFNSPNSGTVTSALSKLFHRRYWTRIWIVQEVVLARKIWVMCGSKRVKWVELEALFSEIKVLRTQPGAVTRTGTWWLRLTNSPAAELVLERHGGRGHEALPPKPAGTLRDPVGLSGQAGQGVWPHRSQLEQNRGQLHEERRIYLRRGPSFGVPSGGPIRGQGLHGLSKLTDGSAVRSKALPAPRHRNYQFPAAANSVTFRNDSRDEQVCGKAGSPALCQGGRGCDQERRGCV